MADEVKAVEYVSQVYDVKTMADHTYRLTFILPEYCSRQAAWFLEHHGDGVRSISQLEIKTKQDDETVQPTKKKAKRSRAKLDSRRLRDRRDQ